MVGRFGRMGKVSWSGVVRPSEIGMRNHGLQQIVKNMPNNAINTDSKKRRSFVAPLFAAGYG